MPIVLGLGAGFAAWQGVFALTGGRLWINRADRPDEEEFDSKMAMRAARRRPIEETIAEIGEGRGAQPNTPSIRPEADTIQESAHPVTRSADAKGSRRSTESRSTPSRRQSSKEEKNLPHHYHHNNETTKPAKARHAFFSSPFVHTQARERKTVGTRRGVSSARGMETVLFVPMLSLSFSLRVASPRDVCLSLTTHPPHRVITNGTLLTALLLPLRRMMIL